MNLDDIVQFVERPTSDFYSLRIIDGPYRDVIYTYGKVQVVEDKENDTARLKFDFKLDEVPEHIDKENLEIDGTFKNFMGDILVELLEEKRLHNDELTNGNTEKINK